MKMLEVLKEYLLFNTFSTLAYVCSVAQLISAIAFTGIVVLLKNGELQNFNCFVGSESTTAYKTEVEKACYLRYQEDYNAVLPFYIYVILTSWFPLAVAVLYAMCVKRRVEQVHSITNNTQPGSITVNQEQNTVSFYIYYSYLFHLVVRVLFGILHVCSPALCCTLSEWL